MPWIFQIQLPSVGSNHEERSQSSCCNEWYTRAPATAKDANQKTMLICMDETSLNDVFGNNDAIMTMTRIPKIMTTIINNEIFWKQCFWPRESPHFWRLWICRKNADWIRLNIVNIWLRNFPRFLAFFYKRNCFWRMQWATFNHPIKGLTHSKGLFDIFFY